MAYCHEERVRYKIPAQNKVSPKVNFINYKFQVHSTARTCFQVFNIRGNGGPRWGSVSPASIQLDLRLFCFVQTLPSTCSPSGKAATPGLCNQQALFANAVVYLKEVETNGNPVTYGNLESCILNGGSQLTALGTLQPPISEILPKLLEQWHQKEEEIGQIEFHHICLPLEIPLATFEWIACKSISGEVTVF